MLNGGAVVIRKLMMLAAATVAVAFPTGAWAQQWAELLTKDGKRYVGQIEDLGTRWRLTTADGRGVIINKSDVQQVKYEQPPAQQYQKRLAKLAEDDAAGHFELAMWCKQRGLLKQCEQRLRHVLKLQPNHLNAKLELQKIIERQKSPTKPITQPTTPAETRQRIGQIVLADEKDIQTIRFNELLEGKETDLLVSFRNKALERFWKRMEGEPGYRTKADKNRFFRLRSSQQLERILQAQAAELYGDIEIKSDPRTLREFRTFVQRFVISNCGSAACHGGPKGGKLRLINTHLNNLKIAYTNFHLLNSCRVGRMWLLNRDVVEDSLLLQYGLPAREARLRHPTPIKPAFPRGKRDPSYRRIRDWISSLRFPPRPRYTVGIKVLDQKPEPAEHPEQPPQQGDKTPPKQKPEPEDKSS